MNKQNRFRIGIIFKLPVICFPNMCMFKPKPDCYVGQTRGQCIFQCVIDEVFIETRSFPGSYMSNNFNSTLKFDMRSNKSKFLNDHDQCLKLCERRIECKKYYFLNYPIFWKNPVFRRALGNFTKFFIEYPAHPSTLYEISLKMSVEEYLCLMSSIFSLWFGFSILMFTDFCRLLFIKFRFYFNNLIINQNVKVKNVITNVNFHNNGTNLQNPPGRMFVQNYIY